MSKVMTVLFRALPVLAIVTLLGACASSERHVSSADGYDQAKASQPAAIAEDEEDQGNRRFPVPRMRQQ